MKNSFAFKKLVGLYTLLLVLIPAVIFLSGNSNRIGDWRSKAAPHTATVSFWPLETNLVTNQNYDLELRVDPSLKPASLDLVLSFDPQVVEVTPESPIPGNMYGVYTAKLTDNTKGLVGVSGKGELREGTKFATLKIKTKAAGDPKFSVNYVHGNNVDVKVNIPQYQVQ